MLLTAREAAWQGCRQHLKGTPLNERNDQDRIPIFLIQSVVRTGLRHVRLIAMKEPNLTGLVRRTDLHHFTALLTVDLDAAWLVGGTNLHRSRLVALKDLDPMYPIGETGLHRSRLIPTIDPIWLVHRTDLHHAQHVVIVDPHPKWLVSRTTLRLSRLVVRIDLDLGPTQLVSRGTAQHYRTDLHPCQFAAGKVKDSIFLFLILRFRMNAYESSVSH